MDKDNFRALVRAELERLPIDAPPLPSTAFVHILCKRYAALSYSELKPVECFRALEGCKDLCITEPELKTKGPNKGKVVNARRWVHPSRLPERAPPVDAAAKLRELEARIVALEQHCGL